MGSIEKGAVHLGLNKSHITAMRTLAVVCISLSSLGLLVLLDGAQGFCFPGTDIDKGNHGGHCMADSSGVEYRACYARCDCWSDFPDMGGNKTGEVDALCIMDECSCVYNLDLCPFGTLKTSIWCCNTVGITCEDCQCDTDGNCKCDP